MSSVNLVLRKDKIKSSGEAPLVIRITKDRKSKYKSLGISIDPKHWDSQKQLVKSTYKNSARLNNLLRTKLTEATAALIDLETSSKFFKGEDILQKIEGSKVGVIEYGNRFIQRRQSINSPGMIKRMKTILAKIEKYMDNSDIPMTQVDVRWLYKYEDYLRTELSNSTNTVGANMSGLRSIINEAIREGVIPSGSNPFDVYKIRQEEVDIEFMTEDELLAFSNLQVKPDSKIEKHRDLYLFACNAAGIRIGDLLTLKWKNFDGERLTLLTRKTGDKLPVKLGQTAMNIINKQVGKEDKEAFIFGLLPADLNVNDKSETAKKISSVNALINKNLKILAKRAGINKNIHFHTSRHTFATRAVRKGMPVVLLSKLLTHKSLKTTQKYYRIVGVQLDEAMENYFKD